MFTLHTGETIAGADFDALIDEARAAVAALDGFPRHYPRFVLEQAAIAGALNPDILADAAKASGGGRAISPGGSIICRTKPSAAGMASRPPTAASNSGAKCAACARPWPSTAR